MLLLLLLIVVVDVAMMVPLCEFAREPIPLAVVVGFDAADDTDDPVAATDDAAPGRCGSRRRSLLLIKSKGWMTLAKQATASAKTNTATVA